MSFDTGLFQGNVAAPYAQEFWLNLDDKTRRIMLWDVPMEQRCMALQDCWFRADYVGLAWTGNKVSPSMACWLTAIGPGSKCAMIHFCYARQARPMAMEIGVVMLDSILVETQFCSLIGLLPAPYRHAIRFAQRLGFSHAATLARACPMANAQRACMEAGSLAEERGKRNAACKRPRVSHRTCDREVCDGVLVTMNLRELCKTMSFPAPIQPEPRPNATSSAMILPPLSPTRRAFA